jgi:hypothetical protein
LALQGYKNFTSTYEMQRGRRTIADGLLKLQQVRGTALFVTVVGLAEGHISLIASSGQKECFDLVQFVLQCTTNRNKKVSSTNSELALLNLKILLNSV